MIIGTFVAITEIGILHVNIFRNIHEEFTYTITDKYDHEVYVSGVHKYSYQDVPAQVIKQIEQNLKFKNKEAFKKWYFTDISPIKHSSKSKELRKLLVVTGIIDNFIDGTYELSEDKEMLVKCRDMISSYATKYGKNEITEK